MELWLEDCGILVLAKEAKLGYVDPAGRVVLISKMAVWTQWQQIQKIIVGVVLVDVVYMRAIAAANSASVVVLIKQSFARLLRTGYARVMWFYEA